MALEESKGSILLPEEEESVKRNKELMNRLRDKVRAIGRMERLLRNLRENKLAISNIKK